MGDSQTEGERSFVLAFESTHAAMAAQSTFSKAGRSFALIPTPREISAGCGMSLKFKELDDTAALAFVEEAVPADALRCAALYDAQGCKKISR